MKRIIINADDLGADMARNEGIFEAIRAGTITSVSILSNGYARHDALDHIGSLDLSRVSLGIHFNISEGQPLSHGLRILTGPDGYFPGKSATHRLLMDDKNTALENEITRELDAQIETLKSKGLHLTHIDGHQHVHVFPAAIKAVCASAKKHNIPWIRIPEEPETTTGGDNIDSLIEEAKMFSRIAEAARSYIEQSGLKTTDHFRGLSIKGRLTLPSIEKILEELPPGLTEFMVHPGRSLADHHQAGPFSSFSTTEREKELDVLLSEEFHRILSKTGAILTPFPEAKI